MIFFKAIFCGVFVVWAIYSLVFVLTWWREEPWATRLNTLKPVEAK